MFNRKKPVRPAPTTMNGRHAANGEMAKTILDPAARNPSPSSAAGERVVHIGKGTRIIGQVTDCTMVEIDGVLEGDVVADAVIVRDGGGFRGNMSTENLEAHGVVQGSITVRDQLDIRSTGCVTAAVTYGRLSVALGGRLAGTIQSPDSAESDHHPILAPVEDAPSAQVYPLNGSGSHESGGRRIFAA